MTRIIRAIIAAAALAMLSFNIAHAQGAATITFSDPNCGSWGMTQTGSSFTLTCQSLTCSISALPVSPLPTENVTLTANCGASVNATYAWSQTPAQSGCPAVSASTSNANALNAPGGTVLNCTYKVVAADGAAGGGTAVKSLSWSTGPPPAPTGCAATITPNPSPMTNAGGTATVSVTGCQPAGVTYAWSKNGSAFSSPWSVLAAPAADTLAAGGSAGYTNSYQVQVCNGSTCITVPGTPLSVAVPGTGGGGSAIDVSACPAAGYTGHGIVIPYPVAGNSDRVWTQNFATFGNNDMIVVGFQTPAVEITPGASILLSYQAGNDHNLRLATLSTQPCVVATSTATSSTILGSLAQNQSPNFNVIVTGAGASWQIKLQPSTWYYVNYVNRRDYNGTPSCSNSDCRAYIDLNN